MLCMKTVKDYWRIQGVGRERVAIVCHSHLLWILTRRFKIWGMIFFYIIRQRWCCLYQSSWTIWLGTCQCIPKLVLRLYSGWLGVCKCMFVNLALYKLVTFIFVIYNLVYLSLYTNTISSCTSWQKKELLIVAVCSVSGDTLPGNLTIIPSAQNWVFHVIYQHAFSHLYSSEVCCSGNRLVLTDEDTSQLKP